MSITIKQLRYFLVLSEELHFRRAAERLHISQPPLSASLRQLEEELGCKLVNRDSKKVSLTSAGATFAARAHRVLSELDKARILALGAKDGNKGLIRAGFVPSMIERGLIDLMNEFREANPTCGVELKEVNSSHQIECLVKGEIDVGFINSAELPEGINAMPLGPERLICAMHHKHSLASRNRISLSELQNDPVLLFSRDYASTLHDNLSRVIKQAGIEYETGIDVQSWHTTLSLASQGIGVTLVPECFRNAPIATNVAFAEIDDPDAFQEINCVWRAEDDGKSLSSFLAVTRHFFQYR